MVPAPRTKWQSFLQGAAFAPVFMWVRIWVPAPSHSCSHGHRSALGSNGRLPSALPQWGLRFSPGCPGPQRGSAPAALRSGRSRHSFTAVSEEEGRTSMRASQTSPQKQDTPHLCSRVPPPPPGIPRQPIWEAVRPSLPECCAFISVWAGTGSYTSLRSPSKRLFFYRNVMPSP